MTVGQLSRRIGVPIKALREYTDLGLIYTLGRSPANYRLYDTDALWCVHFIGELRGLGLTVAEIRGLIAAWGDDAGQPVGSHLAELLYRSRERLRQRIAAQQQILERISKFETAHQQRTPCAGLMIPADGPCGLDPHPAGRPYGPRIDPIHMQAREGPAVDTDTYTLATRFTDTVNRAPGVKLWLLRPLLILLAAGEPVTVEQLAAQAGRTVDEIRQALADMPDTEYDTAGRIIGNGLTHNPTPHRYQSGGRTLYAWCAMDTLIFPAIIGHTAQVTSPCRATGEPIRLTATPDGPTHVEPTRAVVSLVTLGDLSARRGARVPRMRGPPGAVTYVVDRPQRPGVSYGRKGAVSPHSR